MPDMRLLLIGGAGYVGKRLSIELTSRGFECVIASRRHEIGPHQVQIDWLAGTFDVDALAQEGPIDVIVLMAMPDRKAISRSNLGQYQASCREGIARLAKVAVELGIKGILHLSTTKVYGPNLNGLVLPDHPTLTDDPYALLHLTCETELFNTLTTNELYGGSLRLSNAFGAPVDPATERWDLIVNEMCLMAANAGKITLGRGAYQLRDFVPMSMVVNNVADYCETIGMCADRKEGFRKTVNLGSSVAISLYEMALRVVRQAKVIFDSCVIVEIVGTPDDTVGTFLGFANDAESNQNTAEWEQQTDLEIAGLLRMAHTFVPNRGS